MVCPLYIQWQEKEIVSVELSRTTQGLMLIPIPIRAPERSLTMGKLPSFHRVGGIRTVIEAIEMEASEPRLCPLLI